VLLLNDDYTPMEFVVHVLERFFSKDREKPRIMLHVHQKGVGECGVYTYEVAETKVTQVMDFARSNPIRCNAPWKKIGAAECQLFQKSRKGPASRAGLCQ
jgi:ATP-dependent Clp protease adapter protein ClpS